MMCIICVDIERNKLTALEARRNMGEMASQISDEHKMELLKKVWAKEEAEAEEGQEEYDHLLEWFKQSYEN